MATDTQPAKLDDRGNELNNDREQDAAPPLSEIDAPSQQIPGRERLDKAVGKAVGGTVIPSDIKPSAMPTSTKLDAEKDDRPAEQQPQRQAQPHSTQEDEGFKASPDTEDTTKATTKDTLKKKIVGAYPTVASIGWLEAYKRTDGPQNEFRDKSIWMEEFASSALFGAFWQNAAAMIIIPTLCFIVFKLGGSFVSLVWIIAFGGKNEETKKCRTENLEACRCRRLSSLLTLLLSFRFACKQPHITRTRSDALGAMPETTSPVS